MTINESFLDKYNFLESLLSKIFVPKDNNFGLVSILERLSVEPHSTYINTLRDTRNLLVHSTRIKQSQPFQVTLEVENYLDEIIHFVQRNKSQLKKKYYNKYCSQVLSANKTKLGLVPKSPTTTPPTRILPNHSQISREPKKKPIIDTIVNVIIKKIKNLKYEKSRSKGINHNKNNINHEKVTEAISIIKKWSTRDKEAIFNTFGGKRNFLKSLNQQLAEVLVEQGVDVRNYR